MLPSPAKNTFYLLTLLVLVGIAASFWPAMVSFWKITLAIIVIILLFDLILSYLSQPLSVKRELPGSIPLGVSRDIHLRFTNHSKRTVTFDAFDHYPLEVISEGLPVSMSVAANQYADVIYTITAKQRGKLIFSTTQIKLLSPLQFWYRNFTLETQNDTNVYPNFAAISHYALLATDNNLSQIGIIKKRRRGEGQDFHQLREYREGDALRQIDWKATSRMQKLISREYQDERDQEIIFMLDCGHRMLAKDDDLSHFDHTLNALLLLSYVALRQGDAVGLSTFSGEESRWISPKKGQHTIQNILNTVYDLQPSSFSPDYSKAATELLIRHKKRALVIMLTNARDEDSDDLLPAINLLKKRHLVLLASLREGSIEKLLDKSVDTMQDAIDVSATHHYLETRKQTFDQLVASGVKTMDVTPKDLTVDLINSYLGIKSSGML